MRGRRTGTDEQASAAGLLATDCARPGWSRRRAAMRRMSWTRIRWCGSISGRSCGRSIPMPGGRGTRGCTSTSRRSRRSTSPTRWRRWRRCSRRCSTAARRAGIRRRWRSLLGADQPCERWPIRSIQLGAFGADLAALAGFFDPPWGRPVASITEADQAFVLDQAGFRPARARAAQGGRRADAGLRSSHARRMEDWETPPLPPAI